MKIERFTETQHQSPSLRFLRHAFATVIATLLVLTCLTRTVSAQAQAQTQAQEELLPPARSEPTMQAEFELVYSKYRNSVMLKNLASWEKSVAAYRKMETRNRIISEKHPFPAALFDSPMQPPSLANLQLLDIKTRRDTASAIYFGKADYGISDPSEITNTFLVLRFLKEEGAWYFDNTRIVRIGNDTKLLHQIRIQDYSFLAGNEFQPLSSIPRIPQPVPVPELMAEAWVTSIGYVAEIWVNGFRTGKISNNSGRELVMGGVRRGSNSITIRTRKIPSGKAPPRFEIAIYAAKGPGEKANRVFHMGPTDQVGPEIQSGFTGKVIE